MPLNETHMTNAVHVIRIQAHRYLLNLMALDPGPEGLLVSPNLGDVHINAI